MPSIHRRRFLLALGSATSLAAAWYVRQGWLMPAGQLAGLDESEPVTLRTKAMGAEVAITALHGDRRHAEGAIEAAFAELDQIEEVMSLYRPESQLCRLNRQRHLNSPHPYLLEVLQAAQAMARQTDGAFDVTVQPLWQLFAEARRQRKLPGAEQIAAARKLVDFRQVEISGTSIRLLRAGMAITLNGIAQGFAADRVQQVLQSHGIRHALIDCGELCGRGAKADGSAWSVGIQHPRQPEAYLTLAALNDRALSTSGDYATRFSGDHSDHHIFDPRTGRSPAELSSVSVAAPTAMQADALSTAIFVLGPEAGLQLVQNTAGADALLVLKEGRSVQTAGFPSV